MYMLHVVPGLEDLAVRELSRQLPSLDVAVTLAGFDDRDSLLLVHYRGSPAHLLTLRTVEDVFAVITDSHDLPSDQAAKHAIRAAIARAHDFDEALAATGNVRHIRPRNTTFRVIARKAGEHGYRRVDVRRATELGVLDRFPGWRLVEDNAAVEVWTSVIGVRLIAGLRMSDNTMRQRAYGRVNLRAALKPTVAHAMVALSDPQPDDTFLDPMCGTGTILIERAQSTRYHLLMGGDSDPQAVQATLDAVGPRYKPIDIRLWDARCLPLAARSVSQIVTNMPFGKQVGSRDENRHLYPALVSEWARVLCPGGRMVLLTGDFVVLARALKRHEALAVERRLPVVVRGYRATIVVVHDVTDPAHVAQLHAGPGG